MNRTWVVGACCGLVGIAIGTQLPGWPFLPPATAQPPAPAKPYSTSRPSVPPGPSTGDGPRPVREVSPAQRARSAANLRRIVLAMHAHADENATWANGVNGPGGRMLLSWRVKLLPHLGQADLYKQFRLDEPWDSVNNKKLLARMPDVYRVGFEPAGVTDTYYQMFSGPGAMCDGGQVRTAGVQDGLANTLAVAEVGPPVPWTKPADVPYVPKGPLPAFRPPFDRVWMVGMADGSVHGLQTDLHGPYLRRLIERNDGEVVNVTGMHAVLRVLNPDDGPYAVGLLTEVARLRVVKAGLLHTRDALTAEWVGVQPWQAANIGDLDMNGLEYEKGQLLADIERAKGEVTARAGIVRAAKEGRMK